MVLAGMARSNLRKLLTRGLAMDLGHTSVLSVLSVDRPIIQPELCVCTRLSCLVPALRAFAQASAVLSRAFLDAHACAHFIFNLCMWCLAFCGVLGLVDVTPLWLTGCATREYATDLCAPGIGSF